MQTREQRTSGNPGDMNHPSQAEWMAQLYGELSGAEDARLSAHLAQCGECQAKVSQWRAAMSSLDEWKLPAVRPARPAKAVLKWAVAAALVFGVGIGLAAGYLASENSRNLAALRREMQAEFQVQLAKQREQLLTEVTRVVDERRAQDSGVTLAALRELSAAHRADYNSLHKEMETMAVLTENGLQQAEQQIVNLASNSETDKSNQVH
jgi:uncharacterized membrane-anchored protein YhcB (DUF1043 family)